MMGYYFTLMMTDVIYKTINRIANEVFKEMEKIKDETVEVESLFESNEKMQHHSNDKIIDITEFIKDV